MVDYKKSKHVNVLDFGADPTGTSDSATAIQNAIKSVAAVPGGGSVEIPSGIYLVSNDFIELKDRVEVYGHGFSTQIIGFNKDPKDVRDVDGDNIGCQGVFHMGSYDTYTGDMGTNTPMRFGVRDMFIRGANLDLLNPNIRKVFFEHQIKKGKHVADQYIPGNIAGIIVHTRFDIFNEPEAAPIISNVEIWDTAVGIAILGEHDRAMKVDKVRIRKTRRQGLLVGKPVGHAQRREERSNSGAADNKFVMVEVSDANLGGGYHGAIEVYGAQCKFVACTAWFAVRNKPDSDLYHTTNQYLRKSGAGWAVFGERNMFIGCTAQENGGHGWIVGFKDNQFMNCLGESSSYEDKITLRGAAHTDQAANWYISRNASGARLVAPRSANPKSDRQASRYGFYIESKLDDISIVAGSSRNGNKLTQGDDRHLFFKYDSSVPWRNFYIDINFKVMRTSLDSIINSNKKDDIKF
ncbi:glycosyl hydrolase family 28-related protein [Rothia mucilaginosa]|uniref:glycosyl hydrolase family 28-related protein n=1 Tax=Rothia mucilaginosa TaxID=43675 RepID=UPI003C72BA5E